MARKEHPQGKGAEKRVANKIAAPAAIKSKMPAGAKMPRIIDVTPIKRISMSLADWHKVPDNPIQKEGRAQRKNIGHLRKFVEEHAIVRLGVLPDGTEFKIEGHTRDYIWYFAPWLVDFMPSRLQVDVFPCKDFKEAAERFRRVDNKSAVKNAADEVHGSFRLMGVKTTSKYFKNASSIKTPLGYAYEVLYRSIWNETIDYKQVPTDEQVVAFKDALIALDAVNVNTTKLKAPFVMAFLLAYVKHGKSIIPFFVKINSGDCGQRKGKKMCPVAAIERERDIREIGARSGHIALAVCVLGALDTYMKGPYTDHDYVPPMNMQKVMTVDLDQYLLKANAKRTGRTKKITR